MTKSSGTKASGTKSAAPKAAAPKSTARKSAASSAKDVLNKFKMEAAQEVGVTLKPGYNGHLTSKQAGAVGGRMVKKMIQSAVNAKKS
jgi:hypothetical protein